MGVKLLQNMLWLTGMMEKVCEGEGRSRLWAWASKTNEIVTVSSDLELPTVA